MSELGTAAQGTNQPGSINLKSPFQRKTDVFDSEDFDPTKFVNQIYPDGKHAMPPTFEGPAAGKECCACTLVSHH